MISFQKLMGIDSNIFETAKIKYVRHKDSRKEYREIIKIRSELLKYQAVQPNNVFKDCDYICSFLGIEKTKAIFIGVFKVNGYSEQNGKYLYDLQEIDQFEVYKDRVVIDWGKAAISWHQWADGNDKEVVELLPKGFMGEFPGLLNFILDFSELQRLNDNIEANKTWYHHLSSVNGIYLILDSKEGNQYIGSAYGKEGLWQRWREYAKTGHGGNKKLKELCSLSSEYANNFKYTVLQALPSNITNVEIIALENLYKNKLGTRVFGLNEN